MAKVKIKNIKSVLRSVNKVFTDTRSSNKLLSEISEFSIKRIQQETRKGKDLVRDGSQPDLSDGYKRWRRKVKRGESKVTPASFMRPNLSHLTLTGQLLDSLKAKIDKAKGFITIQPTGNRDDGESNAEVASDLKDRGRVFLGLDKRAVESIRKLFIDELRRNIKKFRQK